MILNWIDEVEIGGLCPRSVIPPPRLPPRMLADWIAAKIRRRCGMWQVVPTKDLMFWRRDGGELRTDGTEPTIPRVH